MPMDTVLWILLPVFIAAGSALLSFYIMQSRMEVAIARERASFAEAQAIINAQKSTFEERVKAAEEAARRKSLDDFMQDFRVEERSYVRETRGSLNSRKTMIMQERLLFRNIPLSDWVEHELVVEEGVNPQQVAPRASVFGPKPLAGEARPSIGRLLQESAALAAPRRPAAVPIDGAA